MQTNQRKTTVFFISAAALLLTSAASRAATNTWTTLTGTNTWSGTNWDAAPSSGADTALRFTNSASGVSYGATNDNFSAVPFVLNQLLFSNASSSATITLQGAGLKFTNTTSGLLPQLVQNGAGSNVIANSLNVSTNTDFGGSGAGMVTVSGVVTGAGTLTKTGNYALKLSSTANTFTGNVNINGGTLELAGGSGATYSGGTITINGASTLLINGVYYQFADKNITFGSAGGGTLNVNSQTSGMLIRGTTGVTFRTSGGARSTISGAFINLDGATRSAIFDVLRGDDATSDLNVSVQIINPGSVVKTGNGIMTLSHSANSYSGGTTISDGTVVAGHANALGTGSLNIASPGTLNLGSVKLSAGALMGGGTITGGSGTPSLAVNQNSNAVFSGVIQNGGAASVALIKNGAGALTLSGANLYSGGTTISNGALFVNGSMTGAVTVVAGSTLGGTGVVSGVVTNWGTITAADASSVGTLTVTNLVMAENSIYAWNYNDTTSDLVNVTGTLTLPNVATVNVSRVSGSSAAFPNPAVLCTFGSGPAATNLNGWVVNGAREDSRALIRNNQLQIVTPTGSVISLW